MRCRHPAEKARVANRRGADDDVAQTGIEVGFDGVEVAYAATELDVDGAADLFENPADHLLVERMSGRQRPRSSPPDRRRAPNVLAMLGPADGGLFHVALLEANAEWPSLRSMAGIKSMMLQGW